VAVTHPFTLAKEKGPEQSGCYETGAEINTKAMLLVGSIAFCFFVEFFRYPAASNGLQC